MESTPILSPSPVSMTTPQKIVSAIVILLLITLVAISIVNLIRLSPQPPPTPSSDSGRDYIQLHCQCFASTQDCGNSVNGKHIFSYRLSYDDHNCYSIPPISCFNSTFVSFKVAADGTSYHAGPSFYSYDSCAWRDLPKDIFYGDCTTNCVGCGPVYKIGCMVGQG
eukprot:TRINITY_DN4714_c0_g1_i1.p1 TRINITY_DN4714_c0_g1~~TRINITY_DN4714_c0_g1_i1.p1  ORF type:complete len:166 (+),score=26.11 TRINITY_DN4714_c0_g1_i1:17-514(+)